MQKAAKVKMINAIMEMQAECWNTWLRFWQGQFILTTISVAYYNIDKKNKK